MHRLILKYSHISPQTPPSTHTHNTNNNRYPFNNYFPTPCQTQITSRVIFRQICCGSNFTLGLSEDGVYSWGNGDGGRLGHGDDSDRIVPTLVEELSGNIVLQISAGYFHSAALVMVPPLVEGGWVYTWGSGYRGQLGQGDKTLSPVPRYVSALLDMNIVVVRIQCGADHNAVFSDTEDLYTWGNNKDGCLGHTGMAVEPDLDADEDEEEEAALLDLVPWTATPGLVDCFNCMIDRVGRGAIRDFSCGKDFTVVATFPYEGPSEEQLQAMEEEAARRAEEEAILREEAEEQRLRDEKKMLKDKNRSKLRQQSQMILLCDLCDRCPGFEPHTFKPTLCKECGHPKNKHNKDQDGLKEGTGTWCGRAVCSRICCRMGGRLEEDRRTNQVSPPMQYNTNM